MWWRRTTFFSRQLPWWIIVSELRWWWLFIVVTHTLNSEWTNSELIERTQISCSGTENSEGASQVSYVSSLLVWTGSRSGPPCWRPSQSSYFCSEEQGGISEEPWARIHESSLHGSLLPADTPPYWMSVIDWMRQLIGLIWYITTSVEFHTGVKTDNRLNSSVSLFRIDCFLIYHWVKNLCSL